MEELEKEKEALAKEVSRYSMAGVLSYLEQEWFNYQDQREKWALDRMQMQRQIDVLEQKNTALENVQYDLLRRIKMLEYALVQERCVYALTMVPNDKTKLNAGLDILALLLRSLPKRNWENARVSVSTIHLLYLY